MDMRDTSFKNTVKKKFIRHKPLKTLRPLLWFLDWDHVDINEDKKDIIVNTVNEGTLQQWRWIIKTYGKNEIRNILTKRLATEFHPESLRLAQVVFSIPPLKYARRSSKIKHRGGISRPDKI